MSVTLDIPPHILERVSVSAASEGLSLDAFITRALVKIANQTDSQQEREIIRLSEPIQKMGLMPDAVLYIADDFDAIPEGFEDYV